MDISDVPAEAALADAAASVSRYVSAAESVTFNMPYLDPDLSPPERTLAQVEGWILGVRGLI
jgi:hypothetical protein